MEIRSEPDTTPGGHPQGGGSVWGEWGPGDPAGASCAIGCSGTVAPVSVRGLASAKGEGERPCVLRCGPTGLRAGDGLHGGDEGKWYGHPATLRRWARPSSCRLRGSPRAHPRPADVGDPAQELAQRHWEVFVETGKRRLPERERISAGMGMNRGDGITAKKEKEAVFTEICLFLT